MKRWLSLGNSFDLMFAALAIAGLLATLQTFAIGRHYIIPSAVLAVTVLVGNIARYGFRNHIWAKQILFWCGFLFTAHAFMALFFSQRYREILGDAFEPVCGVVFALFAFLTWQYARRNGIFSRG
jgi:tellurite resistance protein TehA-like permease